MQISPKTSQTQTKPSNHNTTTNDSNPHVRISPNHTKSTHITPNPPVLFSPNHNISNNGLNTPLPTSQNHSHSNTNSQMVISNKTTNKNDKLEDDHSQPSPPPNNPSHTLQSSSPPRN
eukprot:360446_1